jgi:MFS family permease
MTIYRFVLIGSLNHIAFTGSRVAVALYALHLGANQVTVGTLIALYALCPAFLSIAIGRYADRVSPRLPMALGTVGLGSALLLPAIFPGINALYVSSFLLGFWNQVCNIPLEAAAGGIGGVEKRPRNYAYLGMGFSASTFLGPVVAGLAIDHIGYVPAFPILAAFTAAPLILLWFLPAMAPAAAKHRTAAKRGSVLDLWRIPPLRTTLIAGGVVVSAWDLFQFYMPIYGHSIGLSASAIGTIIGMVAVATFTIRAAIPFLARRLTEAELMTYAIFAAALAFTLLPFFENPYALGAIAFLLGLGFGCGQPISMSLTFLLTPRDRIAEATGLRKTVNQAIHMSVPILFGGLGTAFGFVSVFVTNSVMLVASGLLMRKARLPDTRAAKKQM